MAQYNTPGNPLAAALTGKLHYAHLPQASPYPCGVFTTVSSTPAEMFSRTMERVSVQFTIWDRPESDDPAVLLDIQAKLIALFNWCRLSLTGWNFIAMKKTRQQFGRDEEFQNLWYAQTTFEILISQ